MTELGDRRRPEHDAATRVRFLVPAVTAISLVPWIVYCARTYPAHALYFDHSMYQYTGWCIRHGERLYETVAVPDGPFITWLHAIIQIVAGESDAAFRWADLVIQTAGAFAIGVVIAPRKRRFVWAAAIAALWLAQYFRYDWHWTAQREAYYALVGYLGMALLALAIRRRGTAAVVLSIVGGALVGTQLFGKHIGIIFVALGFVPAVLGVRDRRKRRVLLAALGVTSAIASCLVAIALTGSLAGFWFWYIRVPAPYRYLMGSADPWDLLWAIDRHTVILAAAAAIAGVVAVVARVIPRTYLGFAVAPTLFLAAMVLQRKGHIYQAHPITAGTYLLFAIIGFHLLRMRGKHLVAGAALMLLLVFDATWGLATSSWIDPDPPTELSQLGAPHVNHADLTAAGRKLAELTTEDERVFAYGPAPRLLFEAKRRPSVPPFANFFMNLRKATVIELTPDQRATLEDIQTKIAHRTCRRLHEPPPAMAICDYADWSGGPGLADVLEVCPEASYMMSGIYVEMGTYGCWHVYALRDRAVARSPSGK